MEQRAHGDHGAATQKAARDGAEIDYGPDPNQAPRKIYNTLVMLAYLMDVISPGHRWTYRLKDLIDRHGIDTRHMGFPGDFAGRPIWAQVWRPVPASRDSDAEPLEVEE